jgi:hypothetical protein
MGKSKFTGEQVGAILQRGDRDPMAVVAPPTICRWVLGSPVTASGRMYSQGTRKRLRL